MQYKKRYLIAASSLFVGAAFLANADSLQTVLTENTAWDNLLWTPSGNPGSEDSVKISSSGGEFSLIMDGTEVSVYDFIFDNSSGSQPKLVMSNGAVLQILNSQAGGASSFFESNLDISDSTIIAGSGTLGDPSSYVGDKQLGLWYVSADIVRSTIYGGISSWHGSGDVLNFTDSQIYAKGVALFQIQGNGNTTINFDNTSLTLSKNDDGSWADGLALLAHQANVDRKSITNFTNASQFIAGEATEYGVVSGGSSWMGLDSVDKAWIEVNVTEGSKIVAGSFTVGRTLGAANANYIFNLNGKDADNVSSAWFAGVDVNLATNSSATAADTYLAQIAIGDYADFRANYLNIGRAFWEATEPANHGTASVTVGSNSSLSVISSTGDTGDLRIGSQGAIAGGTSQLLVNGNSSFVKSWYLHMGNGASTGGENILRIENNSTDPAKRNEVWNYGIGLINSKTAGSTVKNYAYIGGNTYLRGGRVLEGGDNSLNFFVARNQGGNGAEASASGTSVLEFDSSKGLIEFDYLFQIQVGHSESTGGTGELIVRGSNFKRWENNYFYLSNNLGVYGGIGSSKENPVGGILTMAADANGFTKISADRIFMTGLLVVDFSDLRGTYEDGISFDLLEYRNGEEDAEGSRFAWLTLCEAIAGGDYEHVNIITRDESDEFWFDLNGSTLTVTYYSSVPEPATFAAIFGALALALAAYRKRK